MINFDILPQNIVPYNFEAQRFCPISDVLLQKQTTSLGLGLG